MATKEWKYEAKFGFTEAYLTLEGSATTGLCSKYAAKVEFTRIGEGEPKVTYNLKTTVTPEEFFDKLKKSEKGIELLLSHGEEDDWELKREVIQCILFLEGQADIPHSP